MAAACASGGPPPDEGPFTLGIVNGSRHDVTVTWTGARQGGGTVAACEVASFRFDDGLWVVNVVGAVDAARFPMRVDTGPGGPRTRTVALDATGRIDADARVPLRDPPCPVR